MPQPDGTYLLRGSDPAQRASRGLHLGFTVLWNSFVLFLAAGAYDLIPGKWEREGYGPGWGLLALAPFALIGVFLVYTTAWGYFGRDELRAGPNYLEFRWGWKFSPRWKSRRYADGILHLNRREDEGNVSWDLSFKCAGSWLNQGCLCQSSLAPYCSADELKRLGEVVSRLTGWPFKTDGR